MSSTCKTVKIICLIMLLLGLITVGCGIYFAVSAPAESANSASTPILSGQMFGITLIVAGICTFGAGISGARGANNPTRLGSFVGFGSVVALLNLAEAALAVMSNQIIWLNVVLCILVGAGVIFASRARNEAKDRI